MAIKDLKRVKTGFSLLDTNIGGGFIQNSLAVISGNIGTGKTIFGLQYIHQGLRNGEPGMIISTKSLPKDIKSQALSFSWNFDKWEKEEMLKIVFYTPNELRTIVGGGAGTILDLIEDISASRLFVDSLGFVSNSFDNFSELVSFSFTFLNTFKRVEVTTLATTEDVSNEKMAIWHHLSDFSISLIEDKSDTYSKKKRILEILKANLTPVGKPFLQYTITSRGIEPLKQRRSKNGN